MYKYISNISENMDCGFDEIYFQYIWPKKKTEIYWKYISPKKREKYIQIYWWYIIFEIFHKKNIYFEYISKYIVNVKGIYWYIDISIS